MDIMNTHNHTLVFSINTDAPEEYMNRWIDLKYKCDTGHNRDIVENIKGYCKLECNKQLPYLNRAEGGLGGNDNNIDKQIRFRTDITQEYKKENDIVLGDIDCCTNVNKWTYQELDDLIYAFTKTANEYVEAECVDGYIKMISINTYNDNYLDSDT
tara:strand:- start:3148 stop:3615 length:468 start_codon:yes stop_codon:yes gene_type:complete